MNKLTQEEMEEIKEIISTHDENDQVYIDAKERLVRNIEILKAEQEETSQQLLEKSRLIVPNFDSNSVEELKRIFRLSKFKRGNAWLDYSEEDFPQIGRELACAFDEYYGPI